MIDRPVEPGQLAMSVNDRLAARLDPVGSDTDPVSLGAVRYARIAQRPNAELQCLQAADLAFEALAALVR